MVNLLNLIGIISSGCILYLALMNSDTVLQLLFFNGTYPINFALLTLVILFVGIFTGAFLVGQFYMVQKEKLNAYKIEDAEIIVLANKLKTTLEKNNDELKKFL